MRKQLKARVESLRLTTLVFEKHYGMPTIQKECSSWKSRFHKIPYSSFHLAVKNLLSKDNPANSSHRPWWMPRVRQCLVALRFYIPAKSKKFTIPRPRTNPKSPASVTFSVSQCQPFQARWKTTSSQQALIEAWSSISLPISSTSGSSNCRNLALLTRNKYSDSRLRRWWNRIFGHGWGLVED